MRLFIVLAVLFISAVVAFIDLPSRSETGCRTSRTGSAPCLQHRGVGGGDVNEDSLNDAHQQPAVVTHNSLPVHQKPEPDSIIYTHQQHSNLDSVPARRWLATSMSATGLVLKEKFGTTWTLRSRISKARSEGALGLTPWYGMALGLMCTTLAAVMLG
ncbi:uncharacterized protein TRUGW13939_05037 [Talaromyces rugulosus]|uniref:Uncharacterized protein n=1 Tax=Talaromyces rugulosus TaxID=121627 RepID=A0A7H8QVC4_TALRU|nr:uncharacterized protein TRUGW13939_05037 [Talaromyces rugulosus]QKX57917.1 hypothetical protein TRUGW13939_05037 [Talaromyces rugulosus]